MNQNIKVTKKMILQRADNLPCLLYMVDLAVCYNFKMHLRPDKGYKNLKGIVLLTKRVPMKKRLFKSIQAHKYKVPPPMQISSS